MHIIRSKVTKPSGWDDPIAHHWRSILPILWGIVPEKPPPLIVDAVSKQLSFQRVILLATRSHPQGGPAGSAKITLHIPPNRPGHKRKIHTTVEPLKGSEAPGDTATIHHILDRSELIRIKHGRRSTWVEVVLVRWEKNVHLWRCIGAIPIGLRYSVDYKHGGKNSSHSLQPFASAKRLDRVQKRALRRPPLPTRCTVQYAPSP